MTCDELHETFKVAKKKKKFPRGRKSGSSSSDNIDNSLTFSWYVVDICNTSP